MSEAVRLLVVDDDDAIRWLVASALESDGYLVRGASCGEEALAMVAQWRPALVLLDIMMPGMDGFGVLAALRAAPDSHDIPVVFLTAYADDETRRRALVGGAQDFLEKPLPLNELTARVRAVLARPASVAGVAP